LKTVIVAMIFVFAYSQELTVKKSWNLLGSTEDLNTSFFRSDCANSVWTYENGSWKNFAHGKERITSFSTIPKGKGFWVFSKDGNCSLNTDTSKNPLSRVYNPSHWVTPSKYVCKKNNGAYYIDSTTNENICSANFNDAKKICLDSVARLPTIDELKEVVIGCGGIVKETYEDSIANRDNEPYHNCYKNLGLYRNGIWSSDISTDKDYPDFVQMMTFYSGDVNIALSNSAIPIKCFGSQEATHSLIIPPEDKNIESVLIEQVGGLSFSQNKIISSSTSFQVFLNDLNATYASSEFSYYKKIVPNWISTLKEASIDFKNYNVFVYRFQQSSICRYSDTIKIDNGSYTIKLKEVGAICSPMFTDYFLVYKIAKEIDTFVVDFFNEKAVVIKNVE